MVTLCKIDGKSYDVLITALEEKFAVQEGSNSGESLYRNREIRDIVGVKIGHVVTFDPNADPEAFDELCDYLFGTTREYVTIEIVHNQTTITYQAAYNTGSRNVSYINDNSDIVGWGELTVEFRPMECQIYPE